MNAQHDFLARRGLTLSHRALARLNEVGVHAQSSVSLEHQLLARRYVVRGIESGGAVKDLGRYVTFSGPDGEPLPYIHPIDALGVNGVHAVTVAPILVRIELFRLGRTCQLLITGHRPGQAENGKRPPLENNLLFRGVNGFMDAKLLDKVGCSDELSVPRFWSRAGETLDIPAKFAAAVAAAIRGASCVGCSHPHFLVVTGVTHRLVREDPAP